MGEPYPFQIASSLAEAKAFLAVMSPSVIITNCDLGDGKGFDLLAHRPNLPLIFFTSEGDPSIAVRAIKAGAADYIIKDSRGEYVEELPVSIRKALEAQHNKRLLNETEERFQHLLANTTNLVLTVDASGRILFANQAWYRQVGYSPKDLVDLRIFDIIHPDEQAYCLRTVESALTGEALTQMETRVICKDGSVIYVRGESSVRKDIHGILQVTCVFQDITELAEAHSALRKSNEQLEKMVSERTRELAESNRKLTQEILEKTEKEKLLQHMNEELATFIYKSSHDLRSPLTSVQGLLELIRMDLPRAPSPMYLDLMNDRLQHLDLILKNLMDLNHIRGSKLSIATIDLKAMIQEVLESLETTCDFGALKISIDIAPTFHAFRNDPAVLRPVLHHLLSNSIKYRNPTVEKPVVQITGSTSKSAFNLVIADNGIGIPEEMQGKVCDMFFRGTELSDGSGLGLYVVQKSLEKLEADFKLESTLGEGTTCSFSIPNHTLSEKKLDARVEAVAAKKSA